MKQLAPMLVASFVSTSAVMVLLAFVWPQFFFLVPGLVPAAMPLQAETPAADSTGVGSVAAGIDTVADHRTSPAADTLQHAAKPDSARIVQAPAAVSPTNTAHPPAWAHGDSITSLIQTLQEIRQRFNRPGYSFADTLSDAEVKTMAQIFEAMDPESAARIINNMDDHAIRKVLTAMKKRQSAKILAALNPQQAARILKAKGDL